MIENLKKEFKNIFGEGGRLKLFFSPGRVNLIGEHIDYNGGYVFPCAINFGTYGIVREREDNSFRMYSLNFKEEGIKSFSIDSLEFLKSDNWANYPKGVIKTFKDSGYKVERGFDILIYGDIPNGAGLSSSASIELLISVILKDLNNLDIDMVEMVKLSQKSENKFIGVNCGIMDQFAIGMGKKDNAILLNCDTLEYEYIPVNLDGYSIVISNTNKKRKLSDSKYNERRATCEKALEILNKNGIEIEYLAELSSGKLDEVKDLLSEEELKKVRHVVTEMERTIKATEFLKKGKIFEFGELLNGSHRSLRDDYDVTGKELDSLVEEGWKIEGVIGSRMTGAGFGGCTVSIVKDECIDNYIEKVGKGYETNIGLKADFYVTKIGDGARKLED